MSDKGKSQALHDEPENLSITDHPSQNPSLLSRIAASAGGLTRNAFSIPNTTEVNSALSISDKGQPLGSTIGPSTQGESSRTSLVSENRVSVRSSTFRGGHNEEHVQRSEADFSSFLDGIDTFKPSEDAGVENDIVIFTKDVLRNAEEEGSFDNAWLRSQNVHPPSSANRTVAEQELRDGEDVLALLCDSTAFYYQQFEVPLEDDENYDWGLSVEQLTQLQAITRELFPPPTLHRNVSTENPLNLVAQSDIATRHGLMGESNADTMDHWREQWEGVLTRYIDEVWGGLLPLVKEARQETEDMKDSSGGQLQPKALRRLEAILGHLQRR